MSVEDEGVWGRIAHLHAQDDYHSEAHIVANRAAAEALRDALNSALETGKAEVEMLAADGKGYTLYVAVEDVSFDVAGTTWALPYVCEYAAEDREHVVRPWQRWWKS